ncbi:MAG TPA: SpoIID/LytB domain-containing protein [Cellulomonas sp.]
MRTATVPRRPLHRAARRLITLVVVAALSVLGVAGTGLGTAQTAEAADSGGTATITGYGYGHGRGMGQYGALGYAVDYGWTSSQILAYYYGGSTLATDAGNPTITVELTRFTGKDLIASGTGIQVNGTALSSSVAAVLVRSLGNGTFQLYTSTSGCGGPWTASGSAKASGLSVTTSTGTVSACESGVVRTYRGALQSVYASGSSYAFNSLPVESYLRGVVPREMPASWYSSGSGRGLQALKAQAVAARSYALSSSRTSGAKTCDTTACQVYYGYSEQKSGGSVTLLEDSRSDTAISQTAGQVMRTSTGAIARTEFSSSTGGWTAGGTFTAVQDLGDATSSNPYHSWTVSIGLTEVASSLGTGTIASMSVTARNGLGADGGRATTVTVTAADGTVSTFTGAQVRTALGLKSDWFSISTLSTVEVQNVITALYEDILGREPDSGGLATWTAVALADGNANRLTSQIVMSTERLQTFIRTEYQNALGRAPEAGGLANWTKYLQAGATVPQLQEAIYASTEGIMRAGGDTGTWVQGVYAGVLGRSASTSERAYWSAKIASLGYGGVVRAIAKSDEAGMLRLTRYYSTMLGRSPDASGIRTFLPLMAGNGDMVLPVQIGASPEYWSRAQTR